MTSNGAVVGGAPYSRTYSLALNKIDLPRFRLRSSRRFSWSIKLLTLSSVGLMVVAVALVPIELSWPHRMA